MSFNCKLTLSSIPFCYQRFVKQNKVYFFTLFIMIIFSCFLILSEGSRFVHAYYVFPQSTDESENEVKLLQQSHQSDHDLDSVGFEKLPNEFLWQKRTFILGMCDLRLKNYSIICYLKQFKTFKHFIL